MKAFTNSKKIIVPVVLALFAVFFIISVLQANDVSQPKNMIDKFFDVYQKNGVTESVEFIFSQNEWVKDDDSQIIELKNRLELATKLIGPYHSFEFLNRKQAGESLVLYSYMVKYDRQPLRFSFLFYNANDNWKVINFIFDNNLEDELKEASRIFRNSITMD